MQKQTITEIENYLKPLAQKLHNFQGDGNNQIFYDGYQWGFFVDGSPVEVGEFLKLEGLITVRYLLTSVN